MDMLRLTLERAKSAMNAVEILTGINEKYDQGGNAHYFENFYYHNAYLIADRTDVWIVETSGKSWVAKRVVDSVVSISNFSQITTNWDLCSKDLKNNSKGIKFNFAKSSNDSLLTSFGFGKQRQVCHFLKRNKF
jgi:secernin